MAISVQGAMFAHGNLPRVSADLAWEVRDLGDSCSVSFRGLVIDTNYSGFLKAKKISVAWPFFILLL